VPVADRGPAAALQGYELVSGALPGDRRVVSGHGSMCTAAADTEGRPGSTSPGTHDRPVHGLGRLGAVVQGGPVELLGPGDVSAVLGARGEEVQPPIGPGQGDRHRVVHGVGLLARSVVLDQVDHTARRSWAGHGRR